MFSVLHCFHKVVCVKLPYIISFLISRTLIGKSFFWERLCSFLSTIFWHLSRSWRFLFLLKAEIGCSWNTSLSSWFISTKLQLLVIAFFILVMYGCMSVQVVFYYFVFCFLFEELFSVQSLSFLHTLVYSLLSLSFFNYLILFQLRNFFNSCYVIYRNYLASHYLLRNCGKKCKACANGDLRFKDWGCSDSGCKLTCWLDCFL